MRPIAAPVCSGPVGPMSPPLRALLVVCLFLPEWMYCADSDEVAEPSVEVPAVSRLDVVPPRPYVTPTSDFVLHARMLDAANGVLPAHANLQWTVGSGLSKTSAAGDSIVLHVTATAPGTTLLVTAQIASTPVSASATMKLLAPTAPGTADVVFANARPVAPDVVLVDGAIAGGPTRDSSVAFVRAGVLGDFSGTGEIVRLSTNQRFQMWSGDLLAGRKSVDLRPTSAAPLNPFFVVYDATGPGAIAALTDDVAYAMNTFAKQRTGLTFPHAVSPAMFSGTFTLTYGANSECLGLRHELDVLGLPSTAFGPNRLTVVYVDDILEPVTTESGTELASAGLRGYACPYDASVGTVIIISNLLRSSTTLAHELGHAFGLVEPWWGHIDGIPGFSYTNLMWAFGTDAQKNARSILSLGQAFRVNADDHSWLFHLGWPTWTQRDCSDDPDDDTLCPKLAREIVPLP